jgi:hypothetical protein
MHAAASTTTTTAAAVAAVAAHHVRVTYSSFGGEVFQGQTCWSTGCFFVRYWDWQRATTEISDRLEMFHI